MTISETKETSTSNFSLFYELINNSLKHIRKNKGLKIDPVIHIY